MAASPNIIEITGIPKKVTVAPVKQAMKAPAISFLTHPILTITTDTIQLKPTVFGIPPPTRGLKADKRDGKQNKNRFG